MLGKLTTKQCEYILQSNYIGRIGCYTNGKVLVLPVTYVFDGEFIYGRSLEGTKISMMRKNPHVCFQVDNIDGLSSWRSVVVNGKFEELKTEAAQQKARKLFLERLQPLTLGETVDPAREHANPPHTVVKKKKPIIYRIGIDEIAGRFEKQVTL
ncbi:pyridoxamine 5'-phosphate oxidase family protein [Chryseosolibacter indicus]|uniref:Pyridoxamine 5'-phosphate oxidase family protein n=1 Tax=Chryseosolibacter indicus TaxID=2782351 RepID=A0ABS5VQK8_9BACT|nr:pyridoxamine 5'-phosphate oxidase family protein [Chryseosolibacter indicus]MBT1703734.1 pyridoxamine 5'-phosphate oxidase family protein [Chryseosolibacter indicus]